MSRAEGRGCRSSRSGLGLLGGKLFLHLKRFLISEVIKRFCKGADFTDMGHVLYETIYFLFLVFRILFFMATRWSWFSDSAGVRYKNNSFARVDLRTCKLPFAFGFVKKAVGRGQAIAIIK